MTSAHTKAILNDKPIYLTGEKKQIPIKSKRSYSHRIQVHKRRSIKPQLVKDELKFQAVKISRMKAHVHRLLLPEPGFIERLLNKVIRRK